MGLIKGDAVIGNVIKVDNHGLLLVLENKQEAFLPKEEMFINKKKKLTDIFVEGYVLKANVMSKKKDYYVLTQKNKGNKQTANYEDNENKERLNKSDRTNKKIHKNKQLKSYSNISASTNLKIESDATKEMDINIKNQKTSDYKGKEQKITLDSLRSMSKIGNLKISKVKKSERNVDFVDTKEDVDKYLEVPENLIDNIIVNFELRYNQLESVLERVKDRGWLNES